MEKETTGSILIYERKDGAQFEVQLKGETIWLTQNQIANLFVVKKAAVSKHIKNILREGELERKATVSKMETVQREGSRTVTRKVEYYNLDMIISIGYRVSSRRATQFRIWATRVLKEHVFRGYTINTKRLSDLTPEELMSAIAALKKIYEKKRARLL